jgi:hypothetical protein
MATEGEYEPDIPTYTLNKLPVIKLGQDKK